VITDWVARSSLFTMYEEGELKTTHADELEAFKAVQDSFEGTPWSATRQMHYVAIGKSISLNDANILGIMAVDFYSGDELRKKIDWDARVKADIPMPLTLRPRHFVCRPTLLNHPRVLEYFCDDIGDELLSIARAAQLSIDLQNFDTSTRFAKRVVEKLENGRCR